MKHYYILGAGQPNDRAIYFTNTESFYGGEYWGDITEAYLFESMSELAKHLVKYPEIRCFITEIADVTLEKCRNGKSDVLAGKATECAELFRKFNKISYVLNAQ